MSAEARRAAPKPPTDHLVTTTVVQPAELEAQRQQAARERRHASAIGDYAAAESWYQQERVIDAQIAGREQPESRA